MNNKNMPAGIQYNEDLVTHHDQLAAVSEAFKIARTNIEFSSIDSHIKSLMITSSSQTEGKTVTLANLAITYAQMGRKVLLVDADLRRPAVHRCFGYVNRRGLTNVLIGAGHYTDFILPTLTENLSILAAGPIPPNPADLLMSQTMTDLIEELEKAYDLVLIDCPPVGVVTDAAIISTKVDATIFVVRSGQTNKHLLKRSVALLEQVNARVLGFIMNGVREDSDDYYYYYQQYYYQADSAHEGGEDKRTPRERRREKQRKLAPAQASHKFTAAPLVRSVNPIAAPTASQAANQSASQAAPATAPSYWPTSSQLSPQAAGGQPYPSAADARPLRSLVNSKSDLHQDARTGSKPEAGALISDDD